MFYAKGIAGIAMFIALWLSISVMANVFSYKWRAELNDERLKVYTAILYIPLWLFAAFFIWPPYFRGFAVMALGDFLNVLVISLNNYKMPVCNADTLTLISDERRKSYVVMSDKTRLRCLADIIPLGRNSFGSVGDILILMSFYIIGYDMFNAVP